MIKDVNILRATNDIVVLYPVNQIADNVGSVG
jgi:hypothetical protein